MVLLSTRQHLRDDAGRVMHWAQYLKDHALPFFMRAVPAWHLFHFWYSIRTERCLYPALTADYKFHRPIVDRQSGYIPSLASQYMSTGQL